MNAPQDITDAVNDMLEQLLAGTGRCRTGDLVQAVVTSWAPPGGADEDKWVHCGYLAVSQAARQAVRKYAIKEDETDDRQLILDGYEKLHRAYCVNGQVIRTHLLTVAEAMDVLGELERCETGLRIHKNELLRFIDEVLMVRESGA